MVSMNDVPINDLIEKTAESLKKIPEVKPLEWAIFAKTGMHKERPPAKEDWWYMRAAAILRTTANLGPIGVSKLRTKYGGRKNRGHKPDKFYKGSGNIIRKIFQQLEKAQLVKQINKNGRKGRIIAPKGMALLDRAAYDVSKMPPKQEKIEMVEKIERPAEVKKPEARPETKKQTEQRPQQKPQQPQQTQPQKQPAKEQKNE